MKQNVETHQTNTIFLSGLLSNFNIDSQNKFFVLEKIGLHNLCVASTQKRGACMQLALQNDD